MTSSSHFQALSLEQVLEDLSSRFIVNLPAEELESIERICFQIEQAHWYYEDFVRPQAAHLPSFSLRKFSEIVFRTNPLLSDFNAVTAYDDFLRYKERVPVCGAIILSDKWDKCLIVRGWKSGASWSFPRGKINHDELERDCCVREVWEETGYDISPHFNPSVRPHDMTSTTCPPPLPDAPYPEDDFIEVMMKEQRIRLYIIPGVPEDTLFETKTRKEISKIAWASLTDLPTWSKKNKANKKDIKFYMVTPFVAPLKHWVADRKPGATKRKAKDTSRAEEAATVPQETHDTVDLHKHNFGIDEQTLAARSQELQALFFGSCDKPSASAKSPPLQAYEPKAQAATKSPRIGSDSPTRASVPQSYHQSTSTQSAFSPAADPLSLLRILQQSILQGSNEHSSRRQASSSVDTGSLRSAQDSRSRGSLTVIASTAASTVTGLTPRHRAPSSIASPSFTDYRSSGFSPSSFLPSQVYKPEQPARTHPVGAYTEDERERARDELLARLATQLGTGPTPPSPEDSEDDSGSDADADCASPVQDLLAIFQSQMQSEGSGRQVGDMKLTNAAMRRVEEQQAEKRRIEEERVQQIIVKAQRTMQLEPPSQNGMLQQSPSRSPPQQPPNAILQILNGNQPGPTNYTAPKHGTSSWNSTSFAMEQPLAPQQYPSPGRPSQQASPYAQSLLPAGDNKASLLSLFNTRSTTQGSPAIERPLNGSHYAPSHPPEFANGERLRQFNNYVAQDQRQYNANGHSHSDRANGYGHGQSGGDLAKLFAGAATPRY